MSDRLNILQITTHDSGRHFGCYGYPTVQTPVIDQLAAKGVLQTNYFCAVPICSASRASQLTGLYPQTHGLLDLVGWGWRLRDDVQHASQVFRSAGYRTMLWGVQHEVPGSDLDRLAFDATDPRAETAVDVADRVAAFLRQDAPSQPPFYAQVGFFETHTPFDRNGTQPDTEKGVEVPPYLADTPAAREAMAGYQGSVRQVDIAVGRILDALRESGLEHNTLVVVTTDHGIEMPRAKWHLYDPGIAIGLIMSGPSIGLTGGRRCNQLMSNIDYLPTICDLARVAYPDDVQGHSFADVLRGKASAPLRDAVYGLYHKTQTRYVRTDRYKLIRHFDVASDFFTLPVPIEDTLNKRGCGQVELFDLEADPNEMDSLAGRPELADTQSELETMLWKWMESEDDPLLHGPVRSPSYDEAIRDYHAWKGAERT